MSNNVSNAIELPDTLTAFEKLVIHILRNKKLSIREMIVVTFASASHSTIQDASVELLEVLELDELPKGEELEQRREEIEGAVVRLALNYNNIANVPPLKNQLSEAMKAKYDRAYGMLKAQFNIMVKRKVEEQLEAAVLRRLPDEERKYVEKMKEAMDYHSQIWFGIPHLESLFNAFQPFLENEKLMLQVLHPDRAPADRKDEFGQAMGVFNAVRSMLAKIGTAHRKHLEHIWPIKGKSPITQPPRAPVPPPAPQHEPEVKQSLPRKSAKSTITNGREIFFAYMDANPETRSPAAIAWGITQGIAKNTARSLWSHWRKARGIT